MRSQTILVVEDNAITRKVVRLALGCEGFDVVEATTANEALSSIETSRPDLILQDLRLADVDGVDLVGQLRTLPGMAAVPIIAFSSFLSRLGAHAAACGFTDVLAKPVVPSRLVEVIHKYLPDTAAPEPAPAEEPVVVVARSTPPVLASLLDAGGMSRGALFVTTATGELALAESLGFDPRTETLLRVLGGHHAVFARVIASNLPSAIRATGAGAAAEDLLHRIGVEAAILVPFAGGLVLLARDDVDADRVRDLAARHRAEADAKLMQRVMLAASEAPNLACMFEVVLSTLGEAGPWTLGVVWRPDAEDQALCCNHVWTRSSDDGARLSPISHTTFSRGEGTLGRAWATMTASWSRDLVAEFDGRRRHVAVALGLHAGIVIPVVADGEVIAILELIRDVVTDDDQFVSFASTMVSQLASIIGRKLAVEALEAIEESLRRSDAQLRQAQKMEAVGTLAAGIAHDFNNALAVVLSYSEMILAELPDDASIREDLEEICSAGRSASNLTRQLLMFCRQQVVEPKLIDLDDVLVGFGRMLGRVLGADIELVSLRTPGLGMVWIDPGSLEQVVLNLAVNARDAMPRGGRLTIETANLDLDEDHAHGPFGISTGPHVMLAVTDTGIGMDAVTRSRIFEPFYTTKPHGKGTGLGLSTVFGIIQQSGGAISVRSEPGAGTRFEIYLPRIERAAPATSRLRSPTRPIMTNARGPETVMIVEDADQVRAVAGNILRRSGYTVIEARNPTEAMQLLEQSTRVDLLLSDVVMPQMSGATLAHQISSSRPDIKILQMSGYGAGGLSDARFAYLQKPFTPETLTRKVRQVLDRRHGLDRSKKE